MGIEMLTNLSEMDIEPNEELGQHFLIDQQAINLIANQVEPGSSVIEIGSGPGNLTKVLAHKAGKVVGIELDQRYQYVLDGVKEESGNIDIVFTDALRFPFEKYIQEGDDQEWQIFGNIPYHITEPLLKRLTGIPVQNIVLLMGDNHARLLQTTDYQDLSYSRSSLLAQTFFHIDHIARLEKDCFYPSPRTDSEILSLTPRSQAEYSQPTLAILRELFNSAQKSPTIAKSIKIALDSLAGQTTTSTHTKTEKNRVNRRSTKMELRQYLNGSGNVQEVISACKKSSDNSHRHKSSIPSADGLNLPEWILSSTFSKLDNPSIRLLVRALEMQFGTPQG